MFVSVVIPCYRSAKVLPTLVERLNTVMADATTAFEIILVVDGSPDHTWHVADSLAKRLSPVRAICLARNYGQHNALVAGLRAARYEVIVTMDDDLQHPPEEVPKLLAALTEDVDLVYGVATNEEHGLLRNLTSRVAKTSMALTLGAQNADHASAFRAFRAFMCGGFDHVRGPHASIDVTLSWATTRVAIQTVEMAERAEGRSGYTVGKLVKHALNMALGYSTKPLRMVTYLGFLVGLVGVVLGIRVLWMYFDGRTTLAGFTTVASMIAIFAAAQMVALGVLGEYVGRIHTGGVGRPTYVVRERTDGARDFSLTTQGERARPTDVPGLR